jgi:hypothetical protein
VAAIGYHHVGQRLVVDRHLVEGCSVPGGQGWQRELSGSISCSPSIPIGEAAAAARRIGSRPP